MTEDWRAIAEALDREELERRYAICAEGWATCGLQRARLREALGLNPEQQEALTKAREALEATGWEPSAGSELATISPGVLRVQIWALEAHEALLAQPGEAA